MSPQVLAAAKRAALFTAFAAVLTVPATASAIDDAPDAFGGLDAANLAEVAQLAPPGFEESIAFTGLTGPMAIRC